MKAITLWSLTLATLLSPTPARAQVELEMDPIAYALGGYSLHVADVSGPIRINVGVFGLEIPESFHGNEGWRNEMRGAGLKLDYLGSDPDGFFVGLEGGYRRMHYALAGSGEEIARDIVGIGVRAGYRLLVGGSGLYVAPWVGVGHSFGGADVVMDGQQFERRGVEIFPTVHLGWRF